MHLFLHCINLTNYSQIPFKQTPSIPRKNASELMEFERRKFVVVIEALNNLRCKKASLKIICKRINLCMLAFNAHSDEILRHAATDFLMTD